MPASSDPHPSAPDAPPGSRAMLRAAWAAVVVVVASQLWWGLSLRSSLEALQAGVVAQRRTAEDLEETAVNLEHAVLETRALAERLDTIDTRMDEMNRRLATLDGMETVAAEWDMLAGDVQRAISSVADLQIGLEQALGIQIGGPEFTPPPSIDWTVPELFERARESAAEVGITLAADEVRVPSRIVLVEGILEYFAVLKGSREHETLISLHGNVPPEERRPADFGVRLNNAIQALGFTPGRPIGFSPAGVRPPQGQSIYLFVEWERDGETVTARAEDLIWNHVTGRAMPRGHWVYVGSNFLEGDDGPVFAADVTGEMAATYSRVSTIIDTTAEGAADDTVFLVATPRIPEGVRDVTLVIRRQDREATLLFPDAPPPSDDADDGGTDGDGR